MGFVMTGMIPQWGDANSMFSTSKSLVDKAETLVTQLANQQWFQPYNVQVGYPTIQPPPVPQLPTPPTIPAVVWTTPNAPADFSTAPPDISSLFPPAFDATQPVLNFGALPQPQYGSIPSAPSVNLNFSYPTPVVNLPSAPTLLALDTISFNPFDYTIADFTGEVPTLILNQPNVIAFVEPPPYASGLLDDVLDSLHNAMTSGTDTGLDANTQQAMWDAARDREYRSIADNLATLDRDQEQLGYPLPSGVWADERYKLVTEMHNTTASLSRDIMVKQAEMHLENVMKSREMAITLESKMLDLHNQVAQRAFETAKYETESAIAIYNAQVEIYKARLEGFKATIEAYTAQIEGIKARVAVLNAEIQFEQAKAQINTALVEQYKAQVQAAEAVIDIAKVQVEIIQTQANVEKTKVDVFSAQVQAFVATVNAYTAEVEGYKANAEAQTAIENVYKTQVEAYTARVQAGASQATALMTGYEAQVKGYEAKLEGYKAALEAMVAQAHAQAEYNTSVITEFQALAQATGTYNEVLTKQWQAILDEGLQVAQVQAKVAEANAQLAISSRQTSIEAIKGAASVMAQLGAAALGAIHWSNSSQWSMASSMSSSFSNTTSNSDDHIYSQSA